jgi:hypothetical protein
MKITAQQLASLTPSERSERRRRQFQTSARQRKVMGHVVPEQPYFVTPKASGASLTKTTFDSSNR